MRAQMDKPIGAQSFFGDFRLLKTVRSILNSLGVFPQGLNKLTRSDFPKVLGGDYAGHIPFTLAKEGLAFFRSILEIENPERDAHLFVCRFGRGYDTEDEKRANVQGMQVLPIGILVKDADSPRVFLYDLSPFLLGNYKSDIIKSNINSALYDSLDRIYRERVDLIYIKVETGKTSPMSCPVQERLQERFGFDGSLEMLHLKRLRKENALATLPPGWDRYEDLGFSHLAPESRDFQDYYGAHAGLADGKRVAEIGAGTGVNLLYSLKYGAPTVTATEPEIAYALQALWNLQYAEDTLQIAAGLTARAELILGPGLPPGAADLYLFHAPCIQSSARLAQGRYDLDGLSMRGCFIDEGIFVGIFRELSQRIRADNASALMRVMPGFPEGDTNNFALSRAQLRKLQEGSWPTERIALARASAFLRSFPDLTVSPDEAKALCAAHDYLFRVSRRG